MEKEIKSGKLADPMEIQLQLGVHPEQMPGGAMNPQDPNMGEAPQEGGGEQAHRCQKAGKYK